MQMVTEKRQQPPPALARKLPPLVFSHSRFSQGEFLFLFSFFSQVLSNFLLLFLFSSAVFLL